MWTIQPKGNQGGVGGCADVYGGVNEYDADGHDHDKWKYFLHPYNEEG